MPAGAQHGRGRFIRPKRFIGEHDAQAPTTLGGSRLAFLTARGKPFF
jgi:hypothetical protein